VSDKPKLRARLRPVELVGASAIIGIFVGAVVLLGTREIVVALEWAGVAFVVALVVTAMLLLAATPKDERPDADRNDDDGESRGH
jgi:membrane protein implicated in regulation of membrane protease activity